jgi:hypothetical protein
MSVVGYGPLVEQDLVFHSGGTLVTPEKGSKWTGAQPIEVDRKSSIEGHRRQTLLDWLQCTVPERDYWSLCPPIKLRSNGHMYQIASSPLRQGTTSSRFFKGPPPKLPRSNNPTNGMPWQLFVHGVRGTCSTVVPPTHICQVQKQQSSGLVQCPVPDGQIPVQDASWSCF